MRDGIRHDADPRNPHDDTDQPLNDAERYAKFHAFAIHILDTQIATEIEVLCGRFERLKTTEVKNLLDIILNKP